MMGIKKEVSVKDNLLFFIRSLVVGRARFERATIALKEQYF